MLYGKGNKDQVNTQAVRRDDWERTELLQSMLLAAAGEDVHQFDRDNNESEWQSIREQINDEIWYDRIGLEAFKPSWFLKQTIEDVYRCL